MLLVWQLRDGARHHSYTFRDPDQITYRTYVGLQDDEETKAEGLLGQYAEAGADAGLADGWVAVLGRLFAPARYPLHGAQQVQAYIRHIAPSSSYITNAAAFATADLLRRVTRIAYRTRELQLAHPGSGIGEQERGIWEGDATWQGVRKAVELALIAYDWGEAFTALNVVLLPMLDDVLLTHFGTVARANGDELAWLLSNLLAADARRRERWSTALGAFAVEHRAGNADVLCRRRRRGLGAGCAVAGVGRGRPGRLSCRHSCRGRLSVDGVTASWTPALELNELWEGEMTAVTIGGTSVLIMNVDGDVRAYRNRCPHQESALDEGDFDGEVLTCARHLWEFDARTGAGRNPTTSSLTSFPCRVDDAGMIQVDVGPP